MNLAAGYSDAGIFRAEQNALDGARRYYGDAVRIYEAIVARGVPRARWARPYTLTLKRLGAVEMVTGALADSERHYRQALALETELLRADPANRQWPFERTYTLSDLGLLAQRQGRRDEAIRLWTEARGVRAEALAGDPRNAAAPHRTGDDHEPAWDGPPSTAATSRRRGRASAKNWRCGSGWSPRRLASAGGSSTGRGRR